MRKEQPRSVEENSVEIPRNALMAFLVVIRWKNSFVVAMKSTIFRDSVSIIELSHGIELVRRSRESLEISDDLGKA